MSLDKYRFLQSLERELLNSPGLTKPLSSDTTNPGVAMASIDNRDMTDESVRRSSPRKYLLHRPTCAQLLLYLALCFKDISENSALLLYLSADGSKRQSRGENTNYYTGGIATAVNSTRKVPEKLDQDQNTLIHTLHPHDLVPFTRKPMFVIVDSNNSIAFKDIPKVFNLPFVCLMSPIEYPSSIKDTTQLGSLFTLFLHSPPKAFAFVSDITQMNTTVWTQVVSLVESIEKLIVDLMDQDPFLGI